MSIIKSIVFLIVIIGLLALGLFAQVPTPPQTTVDTVWGELGKAHMEIVRLNAYIQTLTAALNERDMRLRLLEEKVKTLEAPHP